ncbi:hypothetical protein ACUWC2_28400, partial [Klebsiella pneumoniae]|uniref:hypothetical protein n=1 Tax=Klebsiella pneumoniae TaxID=573 RepID=UPI00405558D4
CEFFKNELPFLGYIVTPDGLKTNPKKVEAITKLPYPHNEKTTRQFLGMTEISIEYYFFLPLYRFR